MTVRTIEERLAVVESRLDGGGKEFASIRGQVTEVKTELSEKIAEVKRKPVELGWLLVAIFGAAITIGGILWTASLLFSDRPKWGQLDGVVNPIKAQQSRTDNLVREIETNQLSITGAIKALTQEQANQNRKVDKLLTPPRRR